ncbi:putative bZIP transcription factor (Fcr3) [Aspergillus lucknowensis]|uniref:BZIP domain-containing protein n=1 Tax=Aspergillus lucknowensis TaxID=176173 RepID=A0ABR4LWU7_9EURO
MDQYPYYSGHPSQQPPFPLYGLPTPVQNDQSDDIQGSFDPLNYQPFDQPFQPTGHPYGGPQSPPDSYAKHSVSGSSEPIGGGRYPGSTEGLDDTVADPSLVRSDSEEKDKEGLITSAQSKRKEQNRAAQRAFRERKERHVRELEEKVTNLQAESTTLLADNERLKRELARYSTENEILRATTNTSSGANSNRRNTPNEEPAETGPMIYSPTDFYSDLVPEGQLARLHRVTYCKNTGEKLLDAQATWDLIQGHELFKKGLVDLTGVTKRLKLVTQCDGTGPAFRESHVRKAIEESAAEGDDLL